MTDDTPSALSKTALGMAMVRAEESARPDRLFEDPYAEAFLAAVPDAFADEEAGAATDPEASAAVYQVFSFGGVIRTRFFDDYLLAAAESCPQVVLLAAGLDTRAFRLRWPLGVRLYEVDLPEVLQFKDRVLAGRDAAPRCQRAVVPADLRTDWPARLADAGFGAAERTAWLGEGLLLYLSAAEATDLVDGVCALSAPRSRLALDYGAVPDAARRLAEDAVPGIAEFARLWRGGLGDGAGDLLSRRGWHVQQHDRAEVAASYGRPVLDDSPAGFVTASRADSPDQRDQPG